jgi:anti-sigma regulatory factor (Ser/Thr protein kinase)
MGGYEVPRPRCGQNEDRRVAGGLPVRARNRWREESTGYFDGTPRQVARVREWCRKATGFSEELATPVVLVASELATNAVRHTASCEKYGRIGVSMEFLGHTTVLLGVLDQGRKWGGPRLRPRVIEPESGEPCPGGRGLWLVDQVAEYWWWEGHPDQPLYMRAMVHLDREPELGG